MQHSKEYSTLVMVGSWNIAIFTPEWFAKFLLPGAEVEAEFPLHLNGSLRLSTKNIRMFVLEGKLNLAVRNQSEEAFREVETVIQKIAEYLPHTPVSSFGINFVLSGVEEADVESVKQLCTIQDTNLFESMGFTLVTTSIKRSFKKDGQITNFQIRRNEKKVVFDFNYHFDIDSLTTFRANFEENILLKYRQESMDIVNEIYKVPVNLD